MKAISIKQPWASLICTPRNDNPNLGIKDIENRTWATKYRGKVLIHASGTWFKYPNSDSTLGDLFTDFQWEKIRENYDKNLYSILEPKAITDRLPTSAIIGEVEIIDCVINHPSIWAEKSNGCFLPNNVFYKKGTKPIYNWVLANPVLYEKPILNVKGKLSFWEPDIDIQECIGCSGKFDYESMQQDSAGENYCQECADEMFPLMKSEYDEMVRKGEIEE